MLNRFLAPAMLIAVGAFVPDSATAQPVILSADDECEKWGWLLGTWDSYSPWADQTAPTGGTLIFTLGAGGTIEGRIGKLNTAMDQSGYKPGMLVFRGFKEVRFYGANGTTRFQSFDGEFFQIGNGAGVWRKDTIGVYQNGQLYKTPPAISRLGGGGPFRKSGTLSQTTIADACRPATTSEERTSSSTGEATPPADPPANGPERPARDEKCDWRTYFMRVRDDGKKPLQSHASEASILVSGDDARVIDRKLFPYVRAGFVSFDENEAITRWERIVDEMIANQGADNWLKNLHGKMITGLEDTHRTYWQSAFSKEECPGFTESEGHPMYNLELASAQAIKDRIDDFLKPELEAAQKIKAAYMARTLRKLDNIGALDDKAAKVGKQVLNGALIKAGATEAQSERIVTALTKMREQANAKRDRDARTYQGPADRVIIAALEGIGADTEGTSRRLHSLALGYARGTFLAEAKSPAASTALGVLSLGRYAVEIANGLFDLGTIKVVEDRDLPTTNAVREDVAHLEVLIRRYELVHARFQRFDKEFRKLIADTKAATQK